MTPQTISLHGHPENEVGKFMPAKVISIFPKSIFTVHVSKRWNMWKSPIVLVIKQHPVLWTDHVFSILLHFSMLKNNADIKSENEKKCLSRDCQAIFHNVISVSKCQTSTSIFNICWVTAIIAMHCIAENVHVDCFKLLINLGHG